MVSSHRLSKLKKKMNDLHDLVLGLDPIPDELYFDYKIKPPFSLSHVERFEANNHIRIPEEYRVFILNVS